jgi:glycine cleavage system H lipoate-binding protein
MPCPFLKESRVRYCHASPVRKLIASEANGSPAGSEEKCASGMFEQCTVYLRAGAQPAAANADGRCPYLHESLAQYCSAAPVTRFIPYSESRLSRCAGGGHAYCELFSEIAHPLAAAARDPEVEGIRTPERLYYSRNHMWLELDSNGGCHVGIDAFFGRLAGRIDRIHFLTTKGMHKPTVMLTVNGVDWPLVFPNPLLIGGANLYLRSHPERLVDDPYRRGWLFEGWELPSGAGACAGLMHGPQARAWMEEEVHHASRTIQELLAERQPLEARLLNDGGIFTPGVAQQLSREELMRLLHRFAGAESGWDRNS